METVTYNVSLEDLNALAAPQQRKITRQWVSKYVRLGLMPEQHAPGLGRGKGRQNLYSQSLARQLVPLIQALNVHGKNLGAVGWDLWWYGWYAAPRYWRKRLLEEAKRWDDVRSRLTPKHVDDDGPAELIREIGEQLESNRSRWPMIGSVQRHNKGEMVDFLSILLGVFSGTYMPLSDYDHSTDSFERKKTERLLSKPFDVPIKDADIPMDGTHFPISVEALDLKFQEMSGIGNVNMEDFICSLPDEEVNSARQQMALIMTAVSAAESHTQQQYMRSSGTKAILWANRDQNLQASHLMGWLILLRNPIFKEISATYCAALKEQLGIGQRDHHAA
jgi:hypothetical protein